MSEQLTQFLQIGIVGTALSFVVQLIKEYYGTTSDATRIITIALSIGCGVIFYFTVNTPLWLPIVGILSTATTFYALFIKE
jgi:putative flippase GtrA